MPKAWSLPQWMERWGRARIPGRLRRNLGYNTWKRESEYYFHLSKTIYNLEETASSSFRMYKEKMTLSNSNDAAINSISHGFRKQKSFSQLFSHIQNRTKRNEKNLAVIKALRCHHFKQFIKKIFNSWHFCISERLVHLGCQCIISKYHMKLFVYESCERIWSIPFSSCGDLS